ncbi:unnamed protein product [Strongylus vulgaris]|uniref:Uncharacterized protein n=1 Tax=Strongylus vulgaris TaxID=40348 RepID=A0A3P7IIP1_STRVU|nr:unnamed protein product [Strongylus vulgaris]
MIRLLTSLCAFHAWLSEVEDSRTEGGYVGSEEGPSSDDKEYYLLCRRRASPVLKRRRLSESARFSEAEGSIVSCTAFVHVMERVDGTVYVRFCLEHAGHVPSDQLRQSPPPVARAKRKRHVIAGCLLSREYLEPQFAHLDRILSALLKASVIL